jgi:ABC-type oligopeptide transport system substrate-binding subunit
MSNPVRMVLPVPLYACCYLLIHSPSSLAGPVGSPERHMPGAKFGGVFRRMLGDNPATLDPASLTDIYGQAVVSQIFDSLVQFDAHLRPLPALAKFWEASRDRRTWTFTLRRGVTTHDFIYSFTRLLRVRSPTSAINSFEHIQAAKEFLRRSTSWAIGPSR